MNIDPVSGNEVPIGAKPEEVRDDVDAKLSDGEYVIPADVVRFFGVKHFENMIMKAKKGMEEMHQGGRINGGNSQDDLPFSTEELMTEDGGDGEVQMAEGGIVLPAFDPSQLPDLNFGDLQMPDFNSAMLPSVETKDYVGPDGKATTILFINGEPVTPVPEGYTEKASTDLSESSGAMKTIMNVNRPSKTDTPDPKTTWEKDPSEWSNEDITKLGTHADQHMMVGQVLGRGLKLAGGPIGGLIGKAMQTSTRNTFQNALDEIDKRVAAGSMTEEEATTARTGIQKSLKNMEKTPDGIKKSIFSKAREFLTGEKDMQSYAPSGMNWDKQQQAYVAPKSQNGYTQGIAMGGTRIGTGAGGTAVFSPGDSTPRPQSKPSSISSKGTGMAKGGLVSRRKKC